MRSIGRISGYSVFRGYYKAPKAAREAFTADGWFRTGDICSLDEHGRLSYCGRRKDTFKVPRYVELVTDWPMSATKVRKFSLRDQLVARLNL